MPEKYIIASDGMKARIVRQYVREKHSYLEEYIKIFTQGMKYKWDGNLIYIDLFASCGKAIIADTNTEIDGSPLIALRYPFRFFFFNEIKSEKLEILKQRIQVRFPEKYELCYFYCNDANHTVIDIYNQHQVFQTKPKPLTLIFSDPNNLNPAYSTIQFISDYFRADILFHFSTGMDLSRNIPKAVRIDESKIDKFIGDREWRRYTNRNDIYRYYFKKLSRLGYHLGNDGYPFNKPVLNTRKIFLYHLFLLSKHKLGENFSKISLNYSTQQGDLFSG